MMFWPRGQEAGGFPAGAVSVNLDEGPGLMAKQTLMFLFAGIGGSAAMAQRLGDVYAGMAAGAHRLIRTGLAAHGG
jgi:hypothetical protein